MTFTDLLSRSAEKQKELMKSHFWQQELLDKAPPVLWFGNAASHKDFILTLGANPSRWEFLNKRFPAKERVYLDERHRRFHHLGENQSMDTIIESDPARQIIIDSFNNYFFNNPYYLWFGNHIDPYSVECTLRGLGASFYGEKELQALHFDLIPFTTISDFNAIANQVERDIFKEDWAKQLNNDLLTLLAPKMILVFGRANYQRFKAFYGLRDYTETAFGWTKSNGLVAKCKICTTQCNGIPVAAVSTNLGNPKGFDRAALFELGKKIRSIIQLPS